MGNSDLSNPGRRSMLIGTAAISAGTALSLVLPRRANPQGFELAAIILIPIIAEVTFDAVSSWIDDKFRPRSFGPGEVLPAEDIPAERMGIPNGRPASFASAGRQTEKTRLISAAYSSPIVAVDKGIKSPIQFRRGVESDSLIAGGADGSRVFRIANNWLQWWIDEDNCGRLFNSDTTYGACGVGGCPVELTKQAFLIGSREENSSDSLAKWDNTPELERHLAEHTSPISNCVKVRKIRNPHCPRRQ